MKTISLKISSMVQNEWQVRCIGDVIPELVHLEEDYSPAIKVSEQCCREIADDCRFYLDPNGPETSVGERSAYRALLKQCEAALLVAA
jgi:hypothetical protein